MPAYYNEIEPYAAEWLKNLIREGLIAPGDVDDRDIKDVTPAELVGYTQCHFFAGLGGWSLALRLAGWPDTRPVWTGSCPCQPFSQAGRGGGFADERHLWPYWFHHISVLRPATVFGEQVASPDGLKWFDLVSADLEAAGYAVGQADLCAAGVGAPHKRKRLFFLAYSQELQCYGSENNQRSCSKSSTAISQLRNGNSSEIGKRSYWQICESPFPVVAHGIPARVGRLRAAGNAIVPEVAAEFIRACLGA